MDKGLLSDAIKSRITNTMNEFVETELKGQIKAYNDVLPFFEAMEEEKNDFMIDYKKGYVEKCREVALLKERCEGLTTALCFIANNIYKEIK